MLAALDQAGGPVAGQVRQVLRRDDEYASPGKPPCDWDDPAAREALVDELVRDALAALGALDGQVLPLPAARCGRRAGPGGRAGRRGRRRRGVPDRPQDRPGPGDLHGGHPGPARDKSRNRRFDGYKAHLSVDPDSELIDEVAATAANAPDRDAACELLDEHARGDDEPEVMR